MIKKQELFNQKSLGFINYLTIQKIGDIGTQKRGDIFPTIPFFVVFSERRPFKKRRLSAQKSFSTPQRLACGGKA